MANNPNHPKKGSSIRVDPIKSTKDIKAIKKLLHDKPRDLCLFTLGINTNLRAHGTNGIILSSFGSTTFQGIFH